MAAEYIASEFRGAGLEPGGDDGYFQIARWKLRTPNPAGAELMIRSADRILRVAPVDTTPEAQGAATVQLSPVIEVNLEELPDFGPGEGKGKVVATVLPDLSKAPAGQLRHWLRLWRHFVLVMREAAPELLLVSDPGKLLARRLNRPKLIDPENPPPKTPPIVAVADRTVDAMIRDAAAAETGLRVSAVFRKPVEREVALRNVIGVLRGSDPALKDTAVLLSAHYDHIGMAPSANEDGDRVYNGANDDASGVATIIEIAGALGRLPERPRRSIVFAAFFGEEKGMLGSGYYARHPVFPLAGTVADINLEQVGRTDSAEGPRLHSASITGFDFSDVSDFLVRAGKQTGVRVYKDENKSARFFRLSDNIRLAEKGVPAHSVTVAFVFPDYHGLDDEWEKLNYKNMAEVTRMLALGTLLIADSPEPPRWRADNPATRAYREARKKALKQ